MEDPLNFEQMRKAVAAAAEKVGGQSLGFRVAGKLKFDPIYRLLSTSSLAPKEGEPSYDLGGGMGLLPLVLSARVPFTVIDHDERSLAIGRKIAKTLGKADDLVFLKADLASYSFLTSGHMFLIDILHRWEGRARQDLLERVAFCQRAGERLFLRDLADSLPTQTMLALLEEKGSRGLGQAQVVKPLDFEALSTTLETLGYESCRVVSESQGVALAQRFFTARKARAALA